MGLNDRCATTTVETARVATKIPAPLEIARPGLAPTEITNPPRYSAIDTIKSQ
jgi:hypothetical protein